MRLRSPCILLMIAISHAVLEIPERFRASNNVSFDHDQCIATVVKHIESNLTSYVPMELLFTRGPDGSFNSGPTNMTLTIPACEILCGNMKVNWYTDRGPRLMTWIIPILLLLSNIELSPLDKRRFHTLLQALGDPIDVLWSFLHKIHSATQIYEFSSRSLSRRSRKGAESVLNQPIFVRAVATVLMAFQDVLGPGFADYRQLEDIIDYLDPRIETIFSLWKETGLELSDARTDERLRSCLAIVLYVLQVLSGFIFDIGGGSSNPPGGVIAVALTLTFLIPMVLLSAVTGAFTSRRGALRILRRFVKDGRAAAAGTRAEKVVLPAQLETILANRGLLPSHGEPNWDEYLKSLHWSGGKDTYRPWKICHIARGAGLAGYILPLIQPHRPKPSGRGLGRSKRWPSDLFNKGKKVSKKAHQEEATLPLPSRHRREAFYEFLVATCPILAGLAGGLGILFLAGEGGWSCRHVLLLSMLSSWLLSTALSSGSYTLIWKSDPRLKRYHWWFCLVKDGLIGSAILGWVSITAAGFFNSCSCWGQELFQGGSVGVVLNVNPRYFEYNTNKFPGIERDNGLALVRNKEATALERNTAEIGG
ncbi:hypothetical protein MFIFM68171_11213 [Madurella fahalii]|uniref:Uncharacterized protein n=1 Tax=Madurella fahalii TaxID=1157608 RepID=A0ABQ0GTD4_9PEZI